MQPIHYGAPIYPNCFDLLTTHGVVAEDVVGYITEQPSPSLQNYVAQRGWPPSVPGRILPDPLPAAPAPAPLPKNDVYQTVAADKPANPQGVPTQTQINDFVKQPQHDGWKKAALVLLLTGLSAFGLYKLGAGIKALKNGTAATSAGNFFKNIGNTLKSAGKAVVNFFKNIWAKIKN